MADWVDARLVVDPDAAYTGETKVRFNDKAAPPPSASVCNFFTIAEAGGPQVAVMGTPPRNRAPAAALLNPPSKITRGPGGSKPFSYPLLVQPVLDRHCVDCHHSRKAAGGIILTGTPQGAFTASYNALVERVPFSQWEGGDFRTSNSEPATTPGFFGARASSLMTMLLEGHEKVKLSDEDIERLVTWMDTNALFYGTFNPSGQKRQLRGGRISGPDLE